MLSVIILAAGKGTRMNSDLPKVLHEVAGKTMLDHVIDVSEELKSTSTSVVIGYKKELVEDTINREVSFAIQEDQLGTGHAVMMAEDHIPDDGDVLILYGDTPLLKSDTLDAFVKSHRENKKSLSVLTAVLENPNGYGRIVKDRKGNFIKIVEDKDASVEEKLINEINSGIYCVDAKRLKESLSLIENDNNQNEYYLTDIVEIFIEKNYPVGTYIVENPEEIQGVNTQVDLSAAEEIFQQRIINRHIENGVKIIRPNTVYIEKDVIIGEKTKVLPGAYIIGATEIGKESVIGPNGRLENAIIGTGVEVRDSTVLNSRVDDNSFIGPYAYLRPNCVIGKNVKVGDFVEAKNTTVGDNSKISHLSYIGDGNIGENVNIGCGVVFVNYDGENKHITTVEDNAFVGCNVNLVAPVTIKANAYVAAGSTITDNVPSKALSIARSRQINKPHWVEEKGLFKKKG